MNYYRLPIGPLQANCYVLIDEKSKEAAVIDPGDCTAELVDLLKSKEISKVKYILLTHGHLDHILGVPCVKTVVTDAQVAVHENDAVYIKEPDANLSIAELPYEPQPCEPDILLHDGDKLYLGETEIEVLATPGHSRGSVCYKCEDLIFSGDTLFCMTYGRTDFPGGSESDMRSSFEKLMALQGDYTVLPGHNRATQLSYERTHNRFMRRLRR